MNTKKSLAALITLALLASLFFILLPSLADSAPPVKRPTPTVMPAPASVAQAGPQAICPGCADLIVESISTDPITPTAGVTATINVVIKNNGDGAVFGNFYVDLYISPKEPPVAFLPGDVAWGCQSWYVPPHAAWQLTTTHRFTDTNTFALYAQIDTGNDVTETNELNNVLGPVNITVESTGRIEQSSHQDFQLGLASGLDLSHPDGVIRAGIFEEPWADVGVTTTSVYSPDVMINDVIGTYSGTTLLPTTVEQVKPSIIAADENTIYSVWQDGRHGGTYNNRIYFSRSTDRGVTWSPNVSITQDIPVSTVVNQLAPRIGFDSVTGKIHVVWQDNRNGHYDIFTSSSADAGVTWSPSVKVNDEGGIPNSAKLHPGMVISDGGYIYVTWQDQRNGNDDIYFTRSEDGGATWPFPNIRVTDDPLSTSQEQRNPAIGLGWLAKTPCCDLMRRVIYVGWEDWRDPDHPEIYVSRSRDGGETFGVDVPVELPGGQSYRVAPSLLTWPTTSVYTKEEHIGSMTYYRVVTAVVDIVHVAWQEGKDENADIYYAYSWYSYDEDALRNEPPPWPYEFFFRPKIRVNGYFIDSEYAMPPEPKQRWPIEPTWQGEVQLTKAYSRVYCGDTDTTYHEGVYIAWSDGRSYDRERRDIYMARVGHPTDTQEDVTKHVLVCNNNEVVNSNAKLYAYRDDPNQYALVKPANVRQSNPSITAFTTTATITSVDQVYVAWDDDRWDTPLQTGTRRNRDIFLARTLLDPCVLTGYCQTSSCPVAPYGVYISPVFDTGSNATTWYTLDWWGATGGQTPIFFQTRTGTTRLAPKGNVAANGWTTWSGPGPDNVHTAPGQHIVSPPGRYIQYKLIIDGADRATAVTKVVIHYEDMRSRVFLPLVVRELQ